MEPRCFGYITGSVGLCVRVDPQPRSSSGVLASELFCFLTGTEQTPTPQFPVGGHLPLPPAVLSSTAWSTHSHLSVPHTERREGRKFLSCVSENEVAVSGAHDLQLPWTLCIHSSRLPSRRSYHLAMGVPLLPCLRPVVSPVTDHRLFTMPIYIIFLHSCLHRSSSCILDTADNMSYANAI